MAGSPVAIAGIATSAVHHLSHLNSPEDRVPVDFINGHPIPRWVAAIRHGREGPGITPTYCQQVKCLNKYSDDG